MAKFRKRPVIIEAVKWDGALASLQELFGIMPIIHIHDEHDIVIQTLEGDMVASIGDWIIKGVKGELYPCKPDIFELTYEAV